MKQQLLLLELNEVNFDYIRRYCDRGLLPKFAALLDRHPLVRTRSEERPEALEPWIQWVTAHTGLSLADHGVFRLGDIVARDWPQIWEVLEQQGLKVGAVSPMNAKHRLRDPAFFVPDPWTKTSLTGPRLLQELHAAIAQAVNDNAQAKVTLGSAARLLLGLAAYARPKHYAHYVAYAASAKQKPWRKAIFLDQLLADVFVRETNRTRPEYASLFLNAAAHIQHHYMFCSASYEGAQKNPSWYAPGDVDPVLEVYASYDRIVGDVMSSFPHARLMLATGLHQVPHPELTYYWRIKDHAAFLRELGIPFVHCEPRMSRDFLVACSDPAAAARCAEVLTQAVAGDGSAMFEVDNRGTDVFASLGYSRDIGPDFVFHVGQKRYTGLQQKVAFVALKNGEHDGIGYFLDTAAAAGSRSNDIALSELPSIIARTFGLQFPAPAAAHQIASSPAA